MIAGREEETSYEEAMIINRLGSESFTHVEEPRFVKAGQITL